MTTLGERDGAGRSAPTPAPEARTKSRFNIELTPQRIKRDELTHLSRQLAAFLRAGVPIMSALSILEGDGDSSAVRRVVTQIRDDLNAGSTLTEAFDRHPKDFPLYYRRILSSAELTGRLDEVLDSLADYVEKDAEARRKITSALTYPAIVLGMAVVTVLILVIKVLPQFESFFASLGVELPLTTRILLGVAGFMATWGLPILVLIVVVVGVCAFLVKRGPGKPLWDRIRLRLPVLGPVYQLVLTERFCRLMASLADAGVPLTTSLRVTSETMNNTVYSAALAQAQQSMIDGEGLSQPLLDTELFPTTVVQMIRVGEATGTLETQLGVAATFYQRELDHRVTRLTTLIEPTVVLLVGLVVGFVALALVSAMYGIFQGAK